MQLRLLSAVTLSIGVCLAMLVPTECQAVNPRNAVVKIEIKYRSPDYIRPWSKRSPSTSSGSGVVIEGGRILTNAHVVRYASQIEVQPGGSSEKHEARVIGVAPSIDLAVLEFIDAEVAKSIPAIEIEPSLPELRQSVTVLGYPLGGDELSITEGIVSRIEFTRYYYNTQGLRVQIDAALNPGNSGGPAVSDDRLIGVVFSKIEEADNIGYLIPSEEILRFLDDVEDGAYEGKATISGDVGVQTLENPALRGRLGLDNSSTGVMVKSAESVPEDALRVWDVITHIGPHAIDNQGFVRVSDTLRLNFGYYLDKLADGSGVPLTIIRDGESHEVKAPVERGNHDLLVPLMHDYPDYFIWGPLVFTAASQELVYSSWEKMVNYLAASENPLLGRIHDRQAFEGEQIVMVPNRLFPHRLTRGYQSVALSNVESIDGQKVRSLKHLVELLRDGKGEFVEIRLGGLYPLLVFDRKEAETATEEILADEGVRHQASPALLEVWEAKPNAAP
jgi:S1-C subfamily serine protease